MIGIIPVWWQEKVSEVREAKNTPTRKKGKKENEAHVLAWDADSVSNA